MKEVSLLRAHANRRLKALLERGVRVVELGGRRGGDHTRLFREKDCEYLAVGFEGDIHADLRVAPLPLPDNSQDVVLISMVLMYFDDPHAVTRLLGECRRILAPGGRLIIIEAFIYGETPHKDLPDCTRWTADGMRALTMSQGFNPVTVERLGGVAGVLLSIVREVLPGFLWPLRAICTPFGEWLDQATARIPYFVRRNARYCVGHFTVAVRP